MVRRTPVLRPEDHHSQKQADHHYNSQVNLGRGHVGQDGVVQKYQPKKKTYEIQTEIGIKRRLEEKKQSQRWGSGDDGIGALITSSPPLKRQRSFRPPSPSPKAFAPVRTPAIMDASEQEKENLKMQHSQVNSQGRLASDGDLEEGVLEAAHEYDFIVNGSVSQVQVGADNEVEEFEIGASYEDYKVKPPEYWLTVLTEYNCLVLKKNLTKQIGFTKACVGRHAGDVLRSGKLQLHIDKIEPVNDLSLMLHSKNGPPPTYATIKKVAVRCEEQKVSFPRRHKLLILDQYLKDVVQAFCSSSSQQIARNSTSTGLQLGAPKAFTVMRPRLRDLGDALESNCDVAYNILFTDIMQPALRAGRQKSDTMMRLLASVIIKDLKHWSKDVDDVPSAIENTLLLCELVEEIPFTNSPAPKLQKLLMVATKYGEDGENSDDKVYKDLSIVMQQCPEYKMILDHIVLNQTKYKEGYAELKKLTADVKKVCQSKIADNTLGKLLGKAVNIRGRVRTGANNEVEMLIRTRLQEWASEAQAKQSSGGATTSELSSISELFEHLFAAFPNEKEFVEQVTWVKMAVGHQKAADNNDIFVTEVDKLSAIEIDKSILDQNFSAMGDTLRKVKPASLKGE